MNTTLYKIGDLTESLSITPRTIRYYDQIGLLPDVKRSDGDTRLFDDSDISYIKKIRQLQKEKKLPLEHIREQIFPEDLGSHTALLFSDSLSCSRFSLSNVESICTIKTSESDFEKIEHLKHYILKQATSGTTLFVTFHDPSLTSLYDSLKKELPKEVILLSYPINTIGLTTYMLVEQTQFLLSHYSASATSPAPKGSVRCPGVSILDLMIKKHLSLSFSICVVDAIDHFFTSKKESDITSLIAPHYPVLFSSNAATEVVAFLNKSNPEIEAIIDCFDTAFFNRKRYFHAIELFCNPGNPFAKVIQKELLTLFPSLTITIRDKIAFPEYGDNYCIISSI